MDNIFLFIYRYENPNSFSKSRAPLKMADFDQDSKSKMDRDKKMSQDLKEYRTWRNDKNQSDKKAPKDNLVVSHIKSDYMNWRYGGVNRDKVPHMLSFKVG